VAAVRAKVAHREDLMHKLRDTVARWGQPLNAASGPPPHANSRRGLWHPCPPAGRAQFRLACSPEDAGRTPLGFGPINLLPSRIVS